MEIRKMSGADLERVRDICRSCSPDFPGAAKILLSMYCDYYIEKEPEHCLVLADDDGAAAGYLISSFSWEKYREVFYRDYLPALRRMSPEFAEAKLAEDAFQDEVMKTYPAHFHIDIMGPYRGMGFGSRLVGKITELAAAEGVKGIMLGVGAGNTAAQNFYRKNGFEFIKGNENVKLFGRRLQAVARTVPGSENT